MNIESTSSKVTTSSKTESTKQTTTNPTSETKASFKDELSSIKGQEVTNKDSTEATQTKESEKTAEQDKINKTANEKNNEEKIKNSEDTENILLSKTYNELNSKITALNKLQNTNSNYKTQEISSKSEDKTLDKNNLCKTINMDNQDITFYLNLVDNQQMTAQGNTINGINQNNNAFTDIKAEATQKTVQVSATLMDALNESIKTNKPFRIDFDSDVAVIMKVDKNGVLSANFIPGSAAVENYLKNNIETLKQSFNEQNLPYNELSYSNRQKQNQNENQSQNNKEHKDE